MLFSRHSPKSGISSDARNFRFKRVSRARNTAALIRGQTLALISPMSLLMNRQRQVHPVLPPPRSMTQFIRYSSSVLSANRLLIPVFLWSMRNEVLGDDLSFHQDFAVGLAGTENIAFCDDSGGNTLPMAISPRSHCEVLMSPVWPGASPFQAVVLDRPPPCQPILETVNQPSETLYPHPLAIKPLLTDSLSFPYTPPPCDRTEQTGLTTATESNNTSRVHCRASWDLRRPYDHSVWHCTRRGHRLPAANYESNITRLQERLRQEGANPDAVALVQTIFSDGVTLEALTRRRTRAEATQEASFSQGAGPVYLGFLDSVHSALGESGTRYQCRLCPIKGEIITWKYHRDVLRHLRKEHFGLGEKCFHWYVGSS